MAQVVIATRGGPSAKSRLGAVLPPDLRERLGPAMLEDMLRAIAQTPAAEGVWVVTPTPELAQAAQARGARVLLQSAAGDLNAAFRMALAHVAQAAPGSAAALLPGDLPCLEARDLASALALAEACPLTLAPARRGGTAAVIIGAGETFAPMFGPDSFRRHRAQAEARGQRLAVIEAASLANDLDEPEDLAAIAACAGARATRALLAGYLSGSEFHVPCGF